LELSIELPKPSNRRRDQVHGNGLSGAKPSCDVDELIVIRFKEDAIKTTFIDKPLDQRNLEGLCMTIPVRATFSQHNYVVMAEIVSYNRQGIIISSVGVSGTGNVWKKNNTQKNRQYTFD